ncbi:aldehyde dehydrogenase (NADP(+)) [Ferruginibacter sp.]
MIEGKHIIGFEQIAKGESCFYAVDPVTGNKLDHRFYNVTTDEINYAISKAVSAFVLYRKKSGVEKAAFLECIADEIIALGDELINCCNAETALPKARLEGERTRTINQAKLFAALLKEGSWVDARIDTALPHRQPIARPDIRYMQIALGPVTVFGASNFPLAFSVAGGDTIAALAAGCPVICKAHPAHPATAELVAKAIQAAAIKTNMPDGVFSLLFAEGISAGLQLVQHPGVKAVAFTGSFKGGKALFDAAAAREEPIPVYAEMGSINPVFVLPEALEKYGEKIATGFSNSVTLGVGQFCTNPGMLVYKNAGKQNNFDDQLKNAFQNTTGGVMLTQNMYDNYNAGVANRLTNKDVVLLVKSGTDAGGNTANPVLLKTNFIGLKNDLCLNEELFGPASLVVEAISKNEMMAIAENLSGHLTATIHGTENDLIGYKDLLDILEQKVGRIVINGFPTGVEVCTAMVHGGPYPATTDARSTSVGTAAINRFTRPVCYQDMFQHLLPEELKNENKLNIWRQINGVQTQSDVEM